MWMVLPAVVALAWPAWCAVRALLDMDERRRQAREGRPLTPHEARVVADMRFAEEWSQRPTPKAHNPYGYPPLN